MKALFIIALLLSYNPVIQAQINVALLHQLVDNNRSEHSRQTSLRDQQAGLAAGEQVNQGQGNSLKNSYRNIQKRFSALGMAIEAVQIGLEARPLIAQILKDELMLISLCQNDPYLAPLAIKSQIDFADQAQMLLRYLYGIALSVGELSGMPRADRRLLGSFVVDELRGISQNLSGMIRTIGASKIKSSSSASPFSATLAREKQLAADILSKIKQLK